MREPVSFCIKANIFVYNKRASVFINKKKEKKKNIESVVHI